MMKNTFFKCLYFLLFLTSISCQETEPKLLLVSGDSKVYIVDYEKSQGNTPEIIWTWDAHLADDLPKTYRTEKFKSIADCKSVNNGKQIMVCSSTDGVALLNREDNKVLFYADVPMAHSVAMLPNNLIAVAASTADKGNRVMLFDVDHSEKVVYSDSLYSAHGVVWNSKKKSLFALGFDVLREYKLVSKDSLSLVNEWKIPGESGHDLYPSPDGKGLFMTEHTGVWIFDYENESFDKIEGFPDAENIKSISQNTSGQYLYTVPEEKWWTYNVSFFKPERKLAFPGIRVYKARWIDE